MTLQDLVTTYGDIDVDTLGFIEEVLQWRRNMPPHQCESTAGVWSRWKMLLKKEEEVSSVESTRLAIIDENNRLIRQRNSVKEEIEKCKQENEGIEQEVKDLLRKKESFEELKQKHADLERRKTQVQKDLKEMQRKCNETRELIKTGQSNGWLSQDTRDVIQQIWRRLPQDTLDEFMEKR